NYVLNYTNDLSNSIKNKYRQAANTLWDTISIEADTLWQNEIEELEKALTPYQEQQQQLLKNEEIEANIQVKEAEIQEKLEFPTVDEKAKELLENALSLRLKVNIEEVPDEIIPTI